jgi:polysaccharide export outer membrane protein
MWRLALALAVLGAAGTTPLWAQDSEAPQTIVVVQQPATPPPFVNLRGFSGDYRVGAGDFLDIEVVGQESLTQSVRVSNAGEISLKMLGRIQVVDMTPFEIESAIDKRLKEKGLVEDPESLVFVREYQAKPIYVSGAVMQPGEFIMSQDLTIVDALLLAGGLRHNAGDEALLHRRVSPEAARLPAETIAEHGGQARPGVEIVRIDLRPMKQGNFTEYAIPLQRGDVIVVPDQLVYPFYVAGAVVDPRNFFYVPGKTVTASQAISYAGGPLVTAKMSKGMLVRFDEQGQRTEKPVDFAAILEGRQADFTIQPNDIIFIPGSTAKTLAQALVGLTDTMVMQQTFRVARRMQLPESPDRLDAPAGQ